MDEPAGVKDRVARLVERLSIAEKVPAAAGSAFRRVATANSLVLSVPALAVVGLSLLLAVPLAGCGGGEEMVPVPGTEGGSKSPATVRAQRRAYDGAPPVPPHEDFGGTCTECHDDEGIQIDGLGFAPPTPHADTEGLSDRSRCRQCHVFQQTDEVFVANEFEGLRQDLRRGSRLNPLAPPRIPHKVFMRENCAACHAGPAAREEIRTSHPDRTRCRQCHVPVRTRETFVQLAVDDPPATPEESP